METKWIFDYGLCKDTIYGWSNMDSIASLIPLFLNNWKFHNYVTSNKDIIRIHVWIISKDNYVGFDWKLLHCELYNYNGKLSLYV